MLFRSVRWDSPLFTVGWDDTSPNYADIEEAVLGGKVVRPNAATVATQVVEEGYLYRLDKETQAVVSKVLEWTKDHEGEEGGVVDMESEEEKKQRAKGKKVKVKGHYEEEVEEEELLLQLPQVKMGVPLLQRLRRQYIQLQRLQQGQGGQLAGNRIKEGFVGFLNSAFEKM